MLNILNEGFTRKYLKEDIYKVIEKEVKRELKRKGYNVDAEGADNYIKAAAEYIEMSREYGEDLTADEWLSETEINYPEDLAFMKGLKEQLPEGIATLKDFLNNIETAKTEDEMQMLLKRFDTIPANYKVSRADRKAFMQAWFKKMKDIRPLINRTSPANKNGI